MNLIVIIYNILCKFFYFFSILIVILFWNFECLDDGSTINVSFLCLMLFSLLYIIR